MAQLAEMGVAIPDEFRREMAMAGEWQTISERRIDAEEDEKPGYSALNVGVRKRKLEGQEDEEEDVQRVVKKTWGSATRQYPGIEEDEDLDALLESTKSLKGKGPAVAVKEEVKTEELEEPVKEETSPPPPTLAVEANKPPAIKKEESFQGVPESIPEAGNEAQETAPGVVFKKRKPKFAKK